MRIRMLPFVFIGFMLVVLWIIVLVAAVHANPYVVIAPNGQPTVIYQGTATSPTVILPPSGPPAFVYPGTAPAPIMVMPTLPITLAPMGMP